MNKKSYVFLIGGIAIVGFVGY